MNIQESQHKDETKTDFLSPRQLESIYCFQRQDEDCKICCNIRRSMAIPQGGAGYTMSRYPPVPEAFNGPTEEDAAQDEKRAIENYDADEDVAAISNSRAVEEAQIEEEDGNFDQDEGGVVCENAEVEGLKNDNYYRGDRVRLLEHTWRNLTISHPESVSKCRPKTHIASMNS